MSIKLMSAVWDLTTLTQSQTLVALAIADHADDSGRCFPSIRLIARKARISERRTQQIIRQLEAGGWLETERVPGRSSRYRLFPRGENISPLKNRRGETAISGGGEIAASGGGEIAISPESSLTEKNRQKKQGGAKRSKPGTRLPDDFTLTDELLAFAVDLGVDAEWQFDKFCDYWRGVSGARGVKKDWPATWRNWCRTAAEQNRSSNSKARASRFDSMFGNGG